jgi:hypothetical protein
MMSSKRTSGALGNDFTPLVAGYRCTPTPDALGHTTHWSRYLQRQGQEKTTLAGQAARAHNCCLGAAPCNTALITPLSSNWTTGTIL